MLHLTPVLVATDGEQFFVVREHLGGINDVLHVERSKVEFGQRPAGFYHKRHIRHLGCIEMAKVEFGQHKAISEHITHIRHVFCVEIFDSLDALQFLAVIEPSFGGRRCHSNELRREHHFGQFFFIFLEMLAFEAVIEYTFPLESEVVVVIGERLLCFVVHGVRFLSVEQAEIAFLTLAFVQTRPRVIDMSIVVGCSLLTDERGTILEHIRRKIVLYVCPVHVPVDSLEGRTACEHLIDIGIFGLAERTYIHHFQRGAALEHVAIGISIPRIKMREVEFLDGLAVLEHSRHTVHIARVEMTDVETLQRFASLEHRNELYRLRGVEIVEMLYLFERFESAEPERQVARTVRYHRLIEDNLGDVLAVGFIHPEAQSVAFFDFGVEVERERFVSVARHRIAFRY